MKFYIFLMFLATQGIMGACELKLSFDRLEPEEKIPKFRSAQNPYKSSRVRNYVPTRKGLSMLNISASGQPTIQEILQLKESIPPEKRFILIDLRTEKHLFLNGEPVSWSYSGLEKYRKNYTLLKNQLPQQKEIMVSTRSGKNYKVPAITVLSEKEVTQQLGIYSLTFRTKDHHPPSDRIAEQFVEFVSNLDSNTSIHLHCKGGCGRATTFMIMFDMLHNADQVSKEDIMLRQYCLGGVDIVNEERYRDMLTFLTDFYDYARKRAIDHSLSWLEYKELGK